MEHKYNLSKIIEDRRCYFISPHLDDAILSAGGLISHLAKKNNIKVMTVFTSASSPPYTFFAKRFMNLCGYKNAQLFFKEREREDKNIFNKLNIPYCHLSFVDAGWRKKTLKTNRLAFFLPELGHLYPTRFQILSGQPSNKDFKLINQISDRLQELITDERDIVFCPAAIGNHIDHVIINRICRKTFKKVIYWSDYPYCLQKKISPKFLSKNHLSSIYWHDLGNKKSIINKYRTQKKYLFKNKPLLLVPEVYFINPKYF